MELSLEELRKKKFADLSQDPFQQTKFTRTSNIETTIHKFSQFSKEELFKRNEKVSIAGRIINRVRGFGKLIFADLADQSGIIQLKVVQNEVFAKVSSGDIIGITGKVCKTDIQEKQNKQGLSIEVEKFIILAKCQQSLPDTAYFKLKDTEERFRKRYLDLLINAENRQILIKRHEIIKVIRKFLDEREFIEIETPILVSEASGAQAKPFITRHNKLHQDFYLRIATEIPLKKLLIGGFEKVYEIGRIFRNEGIDARHNPEFTTIEIYQAYENAECMMNLTERIFHYLAKKVLKKGKFEFNSYSVNLQKSFYRISMIEAVKKHAKVDFAQVNNLKKALKITKNHDLKLEKFQKSIGQIILAFFEKYVEKKLIQPTFIYDYPIEVSPLAKSKANNKKIADRFELYIGGLEFANGYSELNDPVKQKERFEEQVKQKKQGNEEIASFDKEFIESLKYGMPPAGGLGIGIDRLTMLLTEQNSIKEVIAFPQIKTKMDKTYRKVKLGEVCSILIGKTPSKEIKEYWCSHQQKCSCVNYYKAGDVVSQSLKTKNRVTELALKKLKMPATSSKSLLYSSRGNIQVFRPGIEGLTFSGSVFLLEPNVSIINSLYFYYLILVNKNRLEKEAHGTSIPMTTKSNLLNFSLVFPSSFAKQQQILAEFQGTYNKILQFKNFHDDNLFKIISKYLEFGDLIFRKYQNDSIKIKDKFKLICGKSLPKKQEDYKTGTIPWINSGVLTNLYFFTKYTQSNKLITKEDYEKYKINYSSANSVLISCIDFNVDDKIVWSQVSSCLIGTGIWKFISTDNNEFESATLFFSLRNARPNIVQGLCQRGAVQFTNIRASELSRFSVNWVNNYQIQRYFFLLLNSPLAKIKDLHQKIKDLHQKIKDLQLKKYFSSS